MWNVYNACPLLRKHSFFPFFLESFRSYNIVLIIECNITITHVCMDFYFMIYIIEPRREQNNFSNRKKNTSKYYTKRLFGDWDAIFKFFSVKIGAVRLYCNFLTADNHNSIIKIKTHLF